MKNGKVVCIVLDGVGIGAAPDAAAYGDENTNTLANTAKAVSGLRLPAMQELGLGNIATIEGVPAVAHPAACYGKMREVSKGKDSTTGHWEIAGIILKKDFPYYPHGFPDDVITKFCSRTGYSGVLGNKAASGTAIIAELGEEHARTGLPIVYTSADSVFQIAAHEEIIPVRRLYEICTIARREVLTGEHAVGRVIARPYIGPPGSYTRTANRKDFSLVPPAVTMLDILKQEGLPTVAIGKIDDLFAGKGVSEQVHTTSNADGIEATIERSRATSRGLVFTNLVDFDAVYGHRQNAPGMREALEAFDAALPRIMATIGKGDLLILTADHGNDPTDESTDHSREYVPLLVYAPGHRQGIDLGTRSSFADLGKTIVHHLGCDGSAIAGISFLDSIV